jgi:hypothetical protein
VAILTGKEADQQLSAWWALIGTGRPGQFIVHVIRLNMPGDPFYALRAYQIWKRHHPNAITESLQQLRQDAERVPELQEAIADAVKAHGNGATNERIVIVPEAALKDPDSHQRYWLEVHGPFLAAACHETIRVLTEEQVRRGGITLPPHDANIWGDNGVLLTFYSASNGSVEERQFLDWAAPGVHQHSDYVCRLRELAREQGRQLAAAALPLAATGPGAPPPVLSYDPRVPSRKFV